MSHSSDRSSTDSTALRDDLEKTAELGHLRPMNTEDHDPFKWQVHQTSLNRLKDAVQRFAGILIALMLVLVLALDWLLGSKLYAGGPTDVTPFHAMNTGPSSLLKELYAPMKIPIVSRVFRASNGNEYTLSDVIYDKPLQNKVLILDIDNRPFDAKGQFLHNETVPWDELDNQSAGLLNHYTYSLIHGYDYKFLRTPTPPDRFPSWAKPSTIATELANYQFVIFMDSDAIWNHLELPLEWLLNHWQFSHNTSLAISEDWAICTAADGNVCLNTGFIVAQQSGRTQEILKAWDGCTTGTQFPGCEELAFQRAYDQKAFNEYIVAEYTEANDLIRLACDETDGSPGAMASCDGVFVRHFWGDKMGVKAGFADAVMRAVGGRVHGSFVGGRETLVVGEGTV